MTELLAKRPFGSRRLRLEQHSLDTEQAAAHLFDPGQRWFRSWVRFFKLTERDAARLVPNLRVAGLLHDLGKANADFQAMVQPGRGPTSRQLLRHEHVSALVLALPAVRQWLARSPIVDVDAVTAAVLSHHLQAAEGGEHRWGQPRTPKTSLQLHLDHPEVQSILERVRAAAQLHEPVPALPSGAWSLAPPWAQAQAEGLAHARALGRSIRHDLPRRGLVLALKAGLIAADSVASALVRSELPITAWIDDVAHAPALTPADVAATIIGARTAQIARRTGRPFVAHRFQDLAAQQGPRALLLAGCGAGKTLAAWRWAQAQVEAHEVGRVVFLYPTRGTATEGFRDYVGWAPEAEAALVHGTARYELEIMQDNPPESLVGKELAVDEASARLYALGLWPRRYYSATVDRFLAFMEHDYGSLCLLPALADSVVVLDEVHSYDRRMFENLLAFLGAFDVPVLCMTATLPPHRRRGLEEKGLRTFPDADARQELPDLELQEARPRYVVRRVAGPSEAREQVVAAYQGGARVLWVVNTVDRCQRAADELASVLGQEVLVYHSRFCLRDRQAAHARTVEAFQQRERPALAVTTQVCEMSLDLDADMLVTELAPVTSLVQRLGRSNRSPSRPQEFRARVLWYVPAQELPYTRPDMAAGLALLGELEGREVSQATLCEALERHAPESPRAREAARFLEGGYYATPGSLREEDGYTRPAVLDDQLDEVLDTRRQGGSIDGYVLPVPHRWVRDHGEEPRASDLPRWLGLAPGHCYSRTRGFVVPARGEG